MIDIERLKTILSGVEDGTVNVADAAWDLNTMIVLHKRPAMPHQTHVTALADQMRGLPFEAVVAVFMGVLVNEASEKSVRLLLAAYRESLNA